MLRYDGPSGEFNGALLSWTGSLWEMRFRDGSVASFLDCQTDREVCSLIERRDPDGHRIAYVRDRSGALLSMESEGQSISFDYDDHQRIVRAYDTAKREVAYAYDDRGRLVRATGSDGIVRNYEYNERNNLVGVREPGRILQNWFDDAGHWVKQVMRASEHDNHPYVATVRYVVEDGSIVESDFDEGDGLVVSRYNAQHHVVSEALDVGAQTPQPGVFHETGTGLTMRYPVELAVRDAQKAIDERHLAVFGSMQNEAKEHALASRCLKPLLLAELTDGSPQGKAPSGASAATLLLFEFIASNECKAGFKYQDDESVAGGLAQVVLQLPGAIALSRPLWYDFGQQQLHIAFSAFGLQNTSPDQPHSLIATAAMRYHGHILGWLMSASQLSTFNGLTKTSIQLDDGKIYPLVPFDLDDHLRLPINIVK